MFRNVKEKAEAKIYQEERESHVLMNHGQKIFCIFHKPMKVAKFPAILFCHGLGGHKVGRYRAYVELAQMLAQKGIGVLRLDFRGSGDSEGDFSSMTLEGEIEDACKGLAFLENHDHVYSNRIGIFGRSLGSVVAVMASSRFDKVKTLCLWAPIYNASDWEDKWKRLHVKDLSHEDKKQLMTIEGQVPGYEFYQQLFSLNLDKDLHNLHNKPMMIIHGNKDDMVKTRHSDLILQKRLQSGGETKYIQLPNSDHHFSYLEERQIAFNETCTWYEETL